MSKESQISLGLAHEFCITAVKAGFTSDDFNRLSKDRRQMQRIKHVLLGYADINAAESFDGNSHPPNTTIPLGCRVKRHKKLGTIWWVPQNIELISTRAQKRGNSIQVSALKRLCAGKRALNANVLAYLLANPRVVPIDWIGKGRTHFIAFWGTTYVDDFSNVERVQFLRWDKFSGWGCGSLRADTVVGTNYFAAVFNK